MKTENSAFFEACDEVPHRGLERRLEPLLGEAAGVLFAPTGLMNGADGDLVPYLLDIAMYVTIGGLFGWLTDVEARRTEDLRRVSRQLEQAYSKLEERAVQLIGIQEYTQSILESITSGVLTVGPAGSVATANGWAMNAEQVEELEMANLKGMPTRQIARYLAHPNGYAGWLRTWHLYCRTHFARL